MGKPLGSRHAPVRYREDVGFELRCPSCARQREPGGSFWPLTIEFWWPERSMTMCRACHLRVEEMRRRRAAAVVTCSHTDRPHHALGLCAPCYWVAYRRARILVGRPIVERHGPREQRREYQRRWDATRRAPAGRAA